jgi:hypothetical protein
VKIEIDVKNVGVLVSVLLSEVEMLRDFLDDAERTLDRQDQLVAEKVEIIKMLGQQAKSAPKKRGRPKGSKNGKSK